MFDGLFRWRNGRQETGYAKMLLLQGRFPLPFDVYLLKFPEGSQVPEHVDEVTCGEHHRVNLVLRHADEGGEFICDTPIYENDRIKYFRSDIAPHGVTRVVRGVRYVLSVGWLKNLD